MKQIDVAIAVIVRENKILICQRKEQDSFGGFWEFPGGKREPGETLHECLKRELREELAIDVEPIAALTPIEHRYPHVFLKLCPFICTTGKAPEPIPIECQRAQWVTAEALRGFTFPPANSALIDDVCLRVAGTGCTHGAEKSD